MKIKVERKNNKYVLTCEGQVKTITGVQAPKWLEKEIVAWFPEDFDTAYCTQEEWDQIKSDRNWIYDPQDDKLVLIENELIYGWVDASGWFGYMAMIPVEPFKREGGYIRSIGDRFETIKEACLAVEAEQYRVIPLPVVFPGFATI